MQYADYALWQRDWMQGEVAASGNWRIGRSSWQGAPAALELPTDRPRPAVQSFRGGVAGFEVAGGVVGSGCSELGRAQGATLFMVLLAGIQVLLSAMERSSRTSWWARRSRDGRTDETEELIVASS